MEHTTIPPGIQPGRPHGIARRAAAFVLAPAVVLGIGGCAVTTIAPTTLIDDKQIEASCPHGHEIAGRAAIDVGAKRRAVAGDAGRLDPVRELVRRTVICGGHLRIDAFAGSSAATSSLYDGDIHLPGATDNARLRREPAITDSVMATVIKNLPIAAATLPPNGTDITAQFGLSAEYKHQLDPDGTRYVLDLVITTDGEQTEGVSLTDPNLTPDVAVQLARRVSVPNLSGADVRLTDIGKVPGESPSSTSVDGLKAFYRTVCDASGAASCTVVTDAAGR